MIPVLYTWDGNAINDGSNYKAYFPEESPIQPSVGVTYVDRPGTWPVYSGKQFGETTLNIRIDCQGNWNSQFQTLIQWFSVEDETPRKLIVKDSADSDKQYYVYATTRSMGKVDGTEVDIVLALSNPIWQSETQNSATWNITATGQSTDFTIDGNAEAYPVLEITPTSYPTNGWIYNSFVQVYPNSTVAWPNRPLCITGTGWDTAALVASTDNYVLINDTDNITDTDTSIVFDGLVGTIPSAWSGYVGTEQISWTGITYTTTDAGTLTGVTRGIGGTSAAAHNDNSVIALSSMLANGADIRIYKDGIEQDYWLSGINTTTTKIWINADIPAKLQVTLKTGFGSTDSVTNIPISATAINLAAMKLFPNSGRILVDSEEFTYTSKAASLTNALSFTVNTRSARNSTAAAHAAGATIRFVPFDINIVYGNLSASAADVDDTYKPIIELTSGNNSFIWDTFLDENKLRSAIWSPKIIKVASAALTNSDYYLTANDAGDAYPANTAGMEIAAYQASGIWKPETAQIEWSIKLPDGITSIESTGERYQYATGWPTVAALQTSANGTSWVNGWNINTAVTSSDFQSWVTWAKPTSDTSVTSGAIWARFFFSGTVTATANNVSKFGATSATIVMPNYPSVTMRSVQNNYQFAATLTTTDGLYFDIDYPLKINETLTIDTDPDYPTAKFNGQIVNGAVNLSSNRVKWLSLQPGSSSITYTAVPTGNVTVTVKWRDRMRFL